jgi:hypothetical protein
MKFLLCFSLAAVVVGFSPVQHATRLSTARSMGMLDDWKTFFSPEEVLHRKQEHEIEMEEMGAAQKEVLDRRRNPSKMKAYHQQEEKRHEQFDHKHDVDIEQEIAREWIVSEKPLTKPVPKASSHSVLDDWKNFFSKPEADHRRVQHHLEMLDTADAEQQRLERNRDPAKMKGYKQQDQRRHQRMDKQHEVEAGFEFAEEQVDPKMKEGQDFIGDVSTLFEM